MIWGDQLIRRGPLRPLKRLLLHSPLVVWAPFASNVYHDLLWYPTIGRSRIRAFAGTAVGPALPDVLTWRPRFASASRRARRATSTSAAPAPRSSTGSSRATMAAPSSSASRTPTARARPTRTSSRSSTRSRWLGLDWDEGPPTPGYRQTERLATSTASTPRGCWPPAAPTTATARRSCSSREREAAQARERDVPLLRTLPRPRAHRRRPAPAHSADGRDGRERSDPRPGRRSSTASSTTGSCVRTDGTPDLQLLRRGRRRHHAHQPRHPRQRPPVEHAQADPLLRGARLRRARPSPTCR